MPRNLGLYLDNPSPSFKIAYILRCQAYSNLSTVNFAMPGLVAPPFPENVSTHPLVVIDYELIKANDAQECDKLWTAATGLGFW